MRQGLARWVVALGLLLASNSIALSQDERDPLRLEGLYPSGARTSVTEAWGTLQFTVANWSDVAKQARVVVFYPSQPDVRYTCDVWVPAQARVTSWVSLGPAPNTPAKTSREIAYQLFDRTDGTDRPVRRREPERLLTRAVNYNHREPTTAVYLDSVLTSASDIDPLLDKDSADSESFRLVQTFRESRGLSDRVSTIHDRYLPPVAEAFDGIDHFVIAGNRLAADPLGRQALRRWVLNGGTLWVLLDRVDPEVVAPILGEGLQFQVVGRTSLTTLRLREARQDRTQAEKRDFDRPVEFVQVALSGSETALYSVNDWPAAFSQSLGRGRVIFTTLGARAWYRPRGPRDPRSRFEQPANLPIATGALQVLAWRLQPEHKPQEIPVDELAPMLRAEVGYEVVGRRTAWIILAIFVLVLVAVAIRFRRCRLPEMIGLCGPAVAVVAAAAFLIAGMHSRQAVPSTAAAVAIVSISPDSGEEQWRGLFAVYNPESGAVQLSSQRGGRVGFDHSGLEGSAWHRVETDLNTWHWENLSFPAGVRVGPFQSSGRTKVSATARFGANGLDGRLSTGAFRNPVDAVLQTRSGAILAVQVNADGSFHVTSDDILPAGQYLRGAVLTDRQQRRQDLYRRFFAESKSPEGANQDRLFVWMETDELPFAVAGATRTVGMMLCIIPIQYENAAEGPITIPNGFIPFTAVTDGWRHPPKLEHSDSLRMRLRFQLPESGRSFSVERATLRIRVHAPGRKVSVFGIANGRPVPLQEQINPVEPIRIEITDKRLLQTDPEGGLYLELAVSERLGPDGREKPLDLQEPLLMWKIENLGLEVVGRVEGK